FSPRSAAPRILHSFPTRRSSDLGSEPADRFLEQIDALVGFGGRHLQGRPEEDQVPVDAVGLTGVGPKDDSVILSVLDQLGREFLDRKSTRLNSSHVKISYAVFCL